MTILWSNNASTTVSGGISAAATSVTLAAGTGVNFPNPVNPGDYYVATFYDQATKTVTEIVHVTAMSGDVATIVRAQEGTVARAWNAGDLFSNLITAGTLRAFMQTGAPAANTTIIYAGVDTSINANHIVANTTPVPSSYAVGMQFNIKVANTNSGATDMALNGQPAVLTKRTDGSDMIGNNLVANSEYIFIWNGTNFSSTIPPVPQEPPQTTFYVRVDSTSVLDSNGIESNTGFANTPSQAFRQIQGAINTIQQRYISQQTITLRVGDGTFTTGMSVTSQYIAAWNIVGDTANPAACIIQATSSNGATYVPGGPAGVCVACGKVGVMTVQGFTFQSLDQNVLNDGNLTLYNIYFTSCLSGQDVVENAGTIQVWGGCQYTGTNAVADVFQTQSGGETAFGFSNTFETLNCTMTIIGTPTVTDAFAVSIMGGTTSVYNTAFTAINGNNLQGRQYYAGSAGGIGFSTSNTNTLPGNSAGVIQAPVPGTDCGGWITS